MPVKPEDQLEDAQRRERETTCPLCLEQLTEDAFECECGVRYHAACVSELGGKCVPGCERELGADERAAVGAFMGEDVGEAVGAAVVVGGLVGMGVGGLVGWLVGAAVGMFVGLWLARRQKAPPA